MVARWDRLSRGGLDYFRDYRCHTGCNGDGDRDPKTGFSETTLPLETLERESATGARLRCAHADLPAIWTLPRHAPPPLRMGDLISTLQS